MTGDIVSFDSVASELRQLGLVLESLPGEYRISCRQAGHVSLCHAEDLTEALAMARDMALQIPSAAPPPLGPVAHRRSRRGQMVNHNRRIASRRRAEAAKVRGKKVRPW